MTAWTRLIRFIPAGGARTPIYGEPIIAAGVDLADAADAGQLDARVVHVESSVFDSNTKVTDEVVRVGTLLGPLAMRDVPDIKCIGLNYRKHSEWGRLRVSELHKYCS
jgi:hypothetical protein